MLLESAFYYLLCLKFSFRLVTFSKSYARKQYCMFFSEHSVQGGPKNGASVFYCKYFENSTTELRKSWWTSAVLYAERSNYLFV